MAICNIHQVEMTERWRRDDTDHTGESFFSHKSDTGWCNGVVKAPKQPTTGEKVLEQVNYMRKDLSELHDAVQDVLRAVNAK